MSQDRLTFQRLAEERLAEAKVLLTNGHPSGAYYLAGYAVELALKATIAAKFAANEIPDKGYVNAIYTHDLGKLLSLAGLKDELNASMAASPILRQRWTIIENWSEQARYDVWTQETAQAILEAIGADEKGLLQWLKTRW
jgi:HEPN domain-containing protein